MKIVIAMLMCSFVAAAVAVEDVPPPQAPWVAPVPERGQWRVSITDPRAAARSNAGEEAAPPSGVERLPVRIESMTWNTVKRDIFTFTDASQATIFYYAGFVLVEGRSTAGGAAPVLVQQLPGTDYVALRSAGWLGMEWLGDSFYVEPVEFAPPGSDGEPVLCYFYRKPEGRGDGSGEWMPELKAWVRVSDSQPVAMAIGSRLFEFEMLEPPAAAPAMTQEQAARLLDLRAQHERTSRLHERNRRLRGE